jgi:hypothetical protein
VEEDGIDPFVLDGLDRLGLAGAGAPAFEPGDRKYLAQHSGGALHAAHRPFEETLDNADALVNR